MTQSLRSRVSVHLILDHANAFARRQNTTLVDEVGQLRDTAARSATALSDARFRAYTLEEKLAALEKSAEATYAERLLLAVKVRPRSL
jgi:hypothetical protein